MQWHTQAGSITTNQNVKLDITLTEIRAMQIVTCSCHMDDSSKGRYDMILGRDILISLWSNLKSSDNVIEEDDGPFKGSTSPMVNLGTYEFKDLNTGNITTQ